MEANWQIGDQIRPTWRTAIPEFLFLRMISTPASAASEAASFGFLEDPGPPTRRPEAPPPPGRCF